MHYVYVLQSTKKQWIYIGCTSDLKQRFAEHNSGIVKSTKPYKPFILIYYEGYLNKTDARRREIELKTQGQQKEILFKKIKNSIEDAIHGPVV